MTTAEVIVKHKEDSEMETNGFSVWDMAETNFDSIFDDGAFSIYMLETIASNESLPGAMLEELVYHPSKEVRLSLASNSNLPSDFLKVLAQDDEVEVRMVLASNRQTSIEVLHMLAQDESGFVSVRAIGTLARIAKTGGALQIDSFRPEHKLLA
jgi:hypothetical protein